MSDRGEQQSLAQNMPQTSVEYTRGKLKITTIGIAGHLVMALVVIVAAGIAVLHGPQLIAKAGTAPAASQIAE